MQNHGLPVLCTVRVAYAFLAKEEGDLNLNKGDIIKVHDNEGGWWKGTLLPSHAYGSFPSNFVEIVDEPFQESLSSSRPPQPQTQQQQSRPHSRQSSVDSSKFTKRKPVTSTLSSNGNINVPSAAAQRKNPQAIIGDMTDLQDAPPPSSPSTAPGPLPGASSAVLPESQPNDRSNCDSTQTSGASAQTRLGQLTSHISQLLGSPASARSLFGQTTEKPSSPHQEDKSNTPFSSSTNGEGLMKSNSSDTMPGSFPGAEESTAGSTAVPVQVTNEAMYNPLYAEKRRSSAAEPQSAMNPSRPGVRNKINTNVLSPTQNVGGHQVGNRYSMPNLVGDLPPPQKQQLDMSDDDMAGGQMASRTEDPQQPGMMPRTMAPANYYSQQFVPVQMPRQHQSGPYTHSTHQERHDTHGYRHSIANFGMQPQAAVEDPLHQLHLRQLQELYGDACPGSSIPHSELSLENLARHNRSHGSIGPVEIQDRQSAIYQRHGDNGTAGHCRSLSQVNLRTQRSGSFDQQYQQEPLLQRRKAGHHTAPLGRIQPMGGRAPSPSSIVIPQPTKARPQSSHGAFGQSFVSSPTDSEANSSGFVSSTPTSSTPRGETPTSAGTSMSAASASYSYQQPLRGEFRQKSKTARMPISTSMTTANFAVRKFSVDARGALANLRTESASQLPKHNRLAREGSITMANISSLQMAGEEAESGQEEDLTQLGTYTAKKPKATLIRAFKQIINPRKVAEKDAIKNKNEHFAWIEMQKGLKRVNSPEPGKERSPFLNGGTAPPMENSTADSPVHEMDPFFVLQQCQVIKDPGVATAAGASINSLDFGPNMFAQVDKVARNVNQRSPHMTPQLLSQKYLTRPYSKAPLSKLRVLFVWVSENIRLEGGPGRDVSGGRYKLGPASDHMSALSAAAVAAGLGSPNMHRPSGIGNASSSILAPTIASTTVGSPIQYSDPAFTTGMEEFARGFLQEDAPELAQEVLTTRTSKTGEGFANLFAEMALAAGIEDIGVVKGFIKGPMDVFSKEIPPANHAWNVVRIEGQYRFIDCCLASPFHPAHYPNRPQQAASFYFLTSPIDLVMSHFPTFLTYQYITPSIPPQIFLKMPFVRPAFFELGLNLVDFKRRSRLDIKDDENVEIVIRIDGCGGGPSSGRFGPLSIPVDGVTGGNTGGSVACIRAGNGMHGTYGGECLGLGCGEGVELRAEVEAMSSEGKVIRKRALAQVMIWNPYHQLQLQPHPNNGSTLVMPATGPSITSSRTATSLGGYATGTRGLQGLPTGLQPHRCSGVKIAKIKAVLPPETVEGPNGVRKGVVHIYAGRKVDNAPSDATPYSLALTLPIQHTGVMPRTPFNFVLPHFSPYEFYVKAPQSELLYYPHTYKFSVLSLAAQAHAASASATAVSVALADNDGVLTNGALATASAAAPAVTATGTHSTLAGIGMVGTVSMAPVYSNNLYHSARSGNSGTPPPPPMTISGTSSTLNRNNPIAQSASSRPPLQHHQKMNSSVSMASTSSLSVSRGQHAVAASSSTNSILSQLDASSLSNSFGNTLGSTFAVPRPERLVLRTQSNRIYKLVYDPVRQCHEAQMEVKERGIWECVRMDDGGKGRVAREGTGGVVIASWKCV